MSRARRSGMLLRGGSALMEVVIALSLLVIAMGVVGFAFRNGQLSLDRSERVTRAILLTDQILTNIDLGIIGIASQAEGGQGKGNVAELNGSFGPDAPPGMSYRIQGALDPLQPGVVRVYIEVFAGDAEDESRKLILATSALRAPPRTVNLERDFGVPAEQLEKITEQIPGGEQIFDPKNFDPRALASMDMDTLIQMLPMILQAFGGGALMGRMDEIMQAAQSGDMQKLQEIAQDAAPPGTMMDPSLQPPRQQGGQQQQQPNRQRKDKGG